MKLCSFAIIVFCLALPLSIVAAEATDAKVTTSSDESLPESAFRPLFDGKTLNGWWQHNGVPEFHRGGKWEVIDGNIVGVQYPPDRGGFLCTKEKFGNFILRFEVNLDYPTDSGVFLRMGEDGKSHQVTLDNRPGGDFGEIYLPWTQASVKKNPEGIKHFKQKAWNTGEIRMEGEPSRIRFWLNGDLVQDFQHTKATTKGVPTSGYIGLQVHPTVTTHVNYKTGNQVRYRNICIHSLDPEAKDSSEKPKTTAASKQ